MSNSKYVEEDLRRYLLSHAEIGAFYIICSDNISPGLIKYFDSTGKAWSLMEDDDELVAKAVEFLRKNGAPLFENVSAAQEFESKWAK
jgi:hypothetical protein